MGKYKVKVGNKEYECQCVDENGTINNRYIRYKTCGIIVLALCMAACQRGMKSDRLVEKEDTCTYVLEDLGLDNYKYNRHLDSLYSDTIQAILSIYASYDTLTTGGEDEVHDAFEWHGVAKARISKFLSKGHKATANDFERFFQVISGIFDMYECGTQYELNLVAKRMIMVCDYHLIDAYKQLMAKYPDAETAKLVNEEYRHLLDIHRRYAKFKYRDFVYSDLQRELGCLLCLMFEAKTASINDLIQSRASVSDVKKNLRQHNGKLHGKSFALTYNAIDEVLMEYAR